jgi:hypothetical protein
MFLLITELHNFGGFFGGDTVTLSGTPWRADGAAERTLTIDESALANVADRHTIAAGMLLDLQFAGERVERAALLGAATHGELRRALGDPPLPDEPLAAPLALAHRCAACELWVPTAQGPARCPICDTPLAG